MRRHDVGGSGDENFNGFLKMISRSKEEKKTTYSSTSSSSLDANAMDVTTNSTQNLQAPKVFGQTLLVVERPSGILLVAFHSPRTRNAFSSQMYQDLIHLLEYAKNNEDIITVVLTGDGPYFSSGADLKELPQQEEDGSDITTSRRNTLYEILLLFGLVSRSFMRDDNCIYIFLNSSPRFLTMNQLMAPTYTI